MTNHDVEADALKAVLRLERQAGREPEDVSRQGVPYDISSPPRMIEVKALSGSARGAAIPLEGSQVDAALAHPENYYLYVVDHVADASQLSVHVLQGAQLRGMIDRSAPRRTYWPTLRAAEYDGAERLV